MRTLRLIRLPQHPNGTFGVLLDEGTPFCLTLERIWLDNRSNESCIPIGIYTCRRVDSPKFGDTFEVTGVPGRSSILFHKGNLLEDTHGCVVVGEEFEPIEGVPGVAASGRAFAEFKGRLKGENEFSLIITEVER